MTLKRNSISIISHPTLSEVWDSANNEGLDPAKIGIKSKKYCHWLCKKCSASFVATVEETLRHKGMCPSCHKSFVENNKNKKNRKKYGSIADVPFIMDLWCNENPDPHTINKRSKTKIKIHCEICGKIVERSALNVYVYHSCLCDDCILKKKAQNYQKRIIEKTGSCAEHPEIMGVWDFEKNTINPQEIPSGSRYKIYCKCPQCGAKWETFAYSRMGKNALCKRCANANAVRSREKNRFTEEKSTLSFADKYPFLATWWHPSMNGEVTPSDISPASHKDYFWVCPNNHTFLSSPQNMRGRRFCPVCRPTIHSSFIEMTIAFYLNKLTRVEQWSKIPCTRQTMDIFLPSLNSCIEYDGVLYHNNSLQYKRDLRKDELLSKMNIRLVRVKEWESEIHTENTIFYDYNKNDIQGLLDALCEALCLPNIQVDLNRDTPAIYQKLYPTVVGNSISKKAPQLIPYWDTKSNGGVTTDKVNVYSTLLFSWKCPVCNAEWKHSPIGMMRRKNLCQVCNPYRPRKAKK